MVKPFLMLAEQDGNTIILKSDNNLNDVLRRDFPRLEILHCPPNIFSILYVATHTFIQTSESQFSSLKHPNMPTYFIIPAEKHLIQEELISLLH